MHVAIIQFDIVWEDKTANHAIIDGLLADAAVPSGSFVLLPELGDTGFSFNLDVIVDDRSIEWARKAAAKFSVWLQVGYARRGPDGRGRNCASVISPASECIGTFEKIHPFSYGREIEHFSGGDHLVIRKCAGGKVCPLVCYDLRFPELWRLAARAGAEVFTIGASWPAARQYHWRSMLIARAIENQAWVIACNRVGNDPHIAYAGGSMIISPMGDVIAEAGDKPTVLSADIDLQLLRDWRTTFPALLDIHDSLLGSIDIDAPI